MKPSQTLLAFVSGFVFSIGLGISGMTDPAKVADFLDLAGAWDPSLAFVMIGAIGVFLPAYRFGKRRSGANAAPVYRLPTTPAFDATMVAGSGVFGVGWALGGYCPAPSLVVAGAGALGAGTAPLVFVGAMLVGMALFEAVSRAIRDRRNESALAE